jgi:hypothetical protein
MWIIIIFLWSLVFSTQGAAQQNCKDCGVAYQKVRLYKPELNAYVLPAYERDIKYLFFDSMMIYERHGLFIETDSKNRETWRRDVIGYTFVDFRTQTFYDYRNFSDTAGLVQVHRKPAEGWIFFGKPRVLEGSSQLPDTVLNSVTYSRLKGYLTKGKDTTLIETMYYIIEDERPLAYFGKVTVNSKRFSFVRLDDLDVASGLKTYSSMDITSRNLSKKELKVFAAWRNAARHHVRK